MTSSAPNLIAMKCSAFLALVVSALVLAGPAGAGVSVWFVADGKPVEVAARGHDDPAGGAAAARRADGRRARPRASLRRASLDPAALAHGLAPHRHGRSRGALRARPRSDQSLQDRVGQLVRTVRGVPGVRGVRVLVEGGVPVGLFPGYDLRRPVTRGDRARRARRDGARLPAASRRPRLHGADRADRRRRHADLDGGARLPEVGRAAARRNARRGDDGGARPGDPPRAAARASPAAGSRCSCAASSRS